MQFPTIAQAINPTPERIDIQEIAELYHTGFGPFINKAIELKVAAELQNIAHTAYPSQTRYELINKIRNELKSLLPDVKLIDRRSAQSQISWGQLQYDKRFWNDWFSEFVQRAPHDFYLSVIACLNNGNYMRLEFRKASFRGINGLRPIIYNFVENVQYDVFDRKTDITFLIQGFLERIPDTLKNETFLNYIVPTYLKK